MRLYTFMDQWMRAWPGIVMDAWLAAWSAWSSAPACGGNCQQGRGVCTCKRRNA